MTDRDRTDSPQLADPDGAAGTRSGERGESRETTSVLHADIQPRQLIITLLGLYARAEHNWLSVAAVIRLMSDLGVEAPTVRSSISRLKRRETLLSVRHDGRAGYALAPSTLDALAEGDVRIFDRKRATLDDGWLMVVFSIPESERDKRHALRTHLTRLGFGTAAPGVWIAPGTLARETQEKLDRHELSSYVDMFQATHLGFGDLSAKVRRWWDLDELSRLYADFVARYRPFLDHVQSRDFTARDAFRAYVPILTEWRRLPYLDPGLPLELLPAGWPGITAGELFDDLGQALAGPAREHAMALIHD